MKKLGKKTQELEQTIYAYACTCIGGQTCDFECACLPGEYYFEMHKKPHNDSIYSKKHNERDVM